MLKSLWVGLTVVVWLVTCLAFVAALASWATAAEPVSVASWRPAGVVSQDVGFPTLQPLSMPQFSALSWRPNNPITSAPLTVSLSSWRPAARDVSPPPLTVPKPPAGPFASYCVGGQCYQSPQQMTPKAWRQWQRQQR
ncbi:MAG TPA: hypothetical protein VL132_15635 [Planctomycetaceae bacterium]|nr:hypothetical protein [Planctomycetaceae bacterium]